MGVVGRLAHAFSHGAHLLDTHSDPIHHRTVFTLATEGSATELLANGAEAAIQAIDLNNHEGDHPRIGALDVAPVVYLGADARDAAREQALAAAERIAGLGVPVFLYGELASIPERRERAFFRTGGLSELRARMECAGRLPHLPLDPRDGAGR